MTKFVDGLEISQDLRVERRQWQAERAGRVLLLVLLVAALLGLFGPGPLSWTEESDGGLEARYERFTRRGGTTAVEVQVAAAEAERGTFAVRFDRDYLSNFAVKSITPNPQSTAVSGPWVVYTFATRTASTDLVLELELTPTGLWAADGTISLPDGDAVTPSHFIYP